MYMFLLFVKRIGNSFWANMYSVRFFYLSGELETIFGQICSYIAYINMVYVYLSGKLESLCSKNGVYIPQVYFYARLA